MWEKRALEIVTSATLSLLIMAACRKPAIQNTVSGPLVEISRPNAVGTCKSGFTVFANWSIDSAEEPFVAVNPVHSNNVVAAWIQGPLQAVVAASTLDGGKTWQRVPIPLTGCSGGPYLWTGDVWLSFSPNGDVYAIAVTSNSKTFSERLAVVSKSGDGGLHWSAANVVQGSDTVDPPVDHPSITADPTHALFAYAIWDGQSSFHGGAGVFTSTTDGGVNWERPRAIIETAKQSGIQFNQILVLPNGTLVDLFEYAESLPDKPPTSTRLQLLRSADRGLTWSTASNAVTMTPLYRSNGTTLVVNPKTQHFVQDPTNPSFAVDSRNGSLYAVWEDGRFSNFQHNDIAFSMSSDGGSTWSAPVRVNQTPVKIPVTDRQAFHPSVAVGRSGTIGISYYDFRFNNANASMATDRWLVLCRPSSARAASDSACWDTEVRLTTKSFNMEAVVPIMPYGLFLGDYFGLGSAGDNFVAVFAQPDDEKVTSIFARRIEY